MRVNPGLLKEAKKVTADIGTTPSEIVRILFAQLVKHRRVPFSLSASDNLVDVERRNRIWRDLDDAQGW